MNIGNLIWAVAIAAVVVGPLIWKIIKSMQRERKRANLSSKRIKFD